MVSELIIPNPPGFIIPNPPASSILSCLTGVGWGETGAEAGEEGAGRSVGSGRGRFRAALEKFKINCKSQNETLKKTKLQKKKIKKLNQRLNYF